ncbi:hypothetical protein [Kibdelosporangium philippinense]|nr:hypothetical protein [Kibdelosporangium philippinense]
MSTSRQLHAQFGNDPGTGVGLIIAANTKHNFDVELFADVGFGD